MLTSTNTLILIVPVMRSLLGPFRQTSKEYDILNALSDEKLDRIHWYVGQHKKRIKKGHVALSWMSGIESGIYAVAQIMSDPLETEEDEAENPYWFLLKRYH